MRRKQRTKVLVEGNPALLERLADQIERDYRVQLVKGPEKSLVMTKAHESVEGGPFYLGETLITECMVLLGDVRGFGAILGDEGDRAFQLAVVDAAYRAKLGEVNDWLPLIEDEEKRIEQKQADEQMYVMKSQIRFDAKEG